MCHSRDFRAFDTQKEKQAEDIRSTEERRAGVIDQLLSGANEEAEKAKRERAPAREAAPAK